MKVTRVFNFQYIQNPEQNLEQTVADYFWMTNDKEQPLRHCLLMLVTCSTSQS